MIRTLLRRTAAVAASAVVAAGAVAAPAHAAVPPGFYRPAYTDTVYEVTWGSTDPVALDYDTWVAKGRPTAWPVYTTYVRYPWSQEIYAANHWDDYPESWRWDYLTAEGWVRAGRPAPEVTTGWIPSTYLHKWGSSPEIFIRGLSTEPPHKLTYDEWARIGFQPFDNRSTLGYQKLSWAPEIVFGNLDQSSTSRVTYARWQAEGFPAPLQRNRFAGDRFVRYSNGQIWYLGPPMQRHITYAEWVAAGRPTPENF